MIDSDDISRKIASLDKLKNEVLVRYFDKLDLEEEIDLYENLINHFFYGDLDDVYDNKVFDNMSIKTRNEILKVVHKYQKLCFYNGNMNNWLFSASEGASEDFNFIVYQLLENYDFLIKLFVVSGEKGLKYLESYGNSEYSDKRICAVANIRNNFVSDDVLFDVFKDITNDDSITNVYTEKERNCLLNYPEGTLYFFGKNGIEVTNSLVLALELYMRLNGESFKLEENRNFLKIIPMLRGFFSNDDGFNDVVMDMFIEYQRKVFSDNDMDFSKYYSINKEVYRDKWMIQEEADSMKINTPFSNKSVDLAI